MDELIDRIIEVLKMNGEELSEEFLENFADELIEQGIMNKKGEFIPKVYEKIENMNNKKQIIYTALREKNKFAQAFFSENPLAFLSIKEIEDILSNPEMLKELGLDNYCVKNLIKATGKIEEYLTPEKVKALGLYIFDVVELIKETGKIGKYLTPEKVKAFGFHAYEVAYLIEETGEIEKYLTPELIEAGNLKGGLLAELVGKTGKIGEYLTPENIIAHEFDSSSVVKLIKESGEIGKYLTPEIIEAGMLSSYEIADLIKKSGEIGKYLTPEKIKMMRLDSSDVTDLIEESGEIEKYLTPEIIEAGNLVSRQVEKLIRKTAKIEKYLTPENIIAYRLNGYPLVRLIEKTGEIEKYLTPEIVKAGNLSSWQVAELIEKTGKIEKYLTIEKVKEFELSGDSIAELLLGEAADELGSLIDEEIEDGTYSYDKVKAISEIFKQLQDSNSARISRIAVELATQIYNLPEEEQQDTIKAVKNIYLTTNLPSFAQNFLVFKQLNPQFMNEDNNSLFDDELMESIPSLEKASKTEKNHIIFSDLLRIAIESNSRELRDYIYIIEQGDQLLNKVKVGKLKIDDKLPESSRKILEKYSEILNALYNQTSQGKRQEKPRINSGNLEQDLKELDSIFLNNRKIHKSLPDRIVRMFGYWAGIRDFEQLKSMMKEIPKNADKRNRQQQDFAVRRGDFAKGIEYTEYFSSMLQDGIVAKDYLGQDASSDSTPLDMDMELIGEDGKIKIATGFTDGDATGRNLGKIILVIKNNGKFIKTRDEEGEINEQAVEAVMNDKSKKECFSNYGAEYGIRTGVGSTNINYIIADRYVDKLGLEIAINGFYIPIVDKNGNVLYTPEMYDEYRSKMQGMSYYGVNEFKLDKTAKNDGTKQIIEIIEQNKREVNQKRKKILQTLNTAIESCGLKMSDKRLLELLEGKVEVVDIGSTGRGTNTPGDGDFDFMVRIDKKLMQNPEEIKGAIKKALVANGEPDELLITYDEDFRFKGVSIEGLQDKVDIDLTFAPRTDELEYTTEESIVDRLDTIKRNNPEDYKYVVANILLAKKVLKTEGAYKKKNAPPPEEGKMDTRGGLGAVGIENWILQNGGSFEKAAREFLRVARQSSTLEEFQQKYPIWDFGENYKARDKYPHDNFVYNMDEEGYSKMIKALEGYIQAIAEEKKKNSEQQSNKKGLGDIVQEDMSVLNETYMMKYVDALISNAHRKEIQSEK